MLNLNNNEYNIDKITLVHGDDTDFYDEVLLVASFKTNLNLDGYKVRLTIQNETDILKKYEVQNNAVEINFDKIITSTLSVGEHKCTLKLIDTLERIRTVKTFSIIVQDEYEADIPKINEYELEIVIDTEGINKYKNYNELHNKPLVNHVVLEGDKTFDELGITKHIIGISNEGIHRHDIDPMAHKDIRDEVLNKQDRLIAGSNITIHNGIISALGAQGGVTTDYKELGNKPEVNGHVLDGDLSLDELGIQAKGDYVTEDILNQKGYLTSVPTGYITEEELEAYNFLQEVPVEYKTDEQNELKYATIENLNLKQNTLTAGENISIVEDGVQTTINSVIPDNYVTEEELINKGYITSDILNNRLEKKQNTLLAGDNIKLYRNIDGSYTISALDSKSSTIINSYNSLSNLPSINGIQLLSNKTSADLGLQPAGDYQDKLVVGDNISIVNNVISAIIPDDLCTDAELAQGLSTKADKATSIEGYNIQDAYTKEEVDKNIEDYIQDKVSDIILGAPNGVALYTEKSITVKEGLKFLYSSGLTKSGVKSLVDTLEQDFVLDFTNTEYSELYKKFYLVLIKENGATKAEIIPQSYFKVFYGCKIPNTEQHYIKHVSQNKFYKMEYREHGIYEPVQIYFKIIGEGEMVSDNGLTKITSLMTYDVFHIVNHDELNQELKAKQDVLTFGNNFEVKNNNVEYKIPFNYVTKEYLIENDYVTQTNINDAINIHNTNNLSHQDIRNLIQNLQSINVALQSRIATLENKTYDLENRVRELERKITR